MVRNRYVQTTCVRECVGNIHLYTLQIRNLLFCYIVLHTFLFFFFSGPSMQHRNYAFLSLIIRLTITEFILLRCMYEILKNIINTDNRIRKIMISIRNEYEKNQQIKLTINDIIVKYHLFAK